MPDRDHASPSAPERIAQDIRNDIESGRLRDGERLKTTRQLAEEYRASQRTITDAMEILAKDGYITARDRSGRFVTTPAELGRTLSSPMRPVRPRIVRVGGFPGSGKSEFARTLARLTNWAILDKDTIARPLIEPALEDLGHSVNDRDSAIYFDRIRPREYDALAAVIEENVECGNSVIATAPYIREFNNQAWLDKAIASAETNDAIPMFVWVQCSIDTMHMYLKKRGAGRDAHKLAHWDEYVANLDLDFRPRTEHVLIDNDPGSEPLKTQAKRLVDSFRSESR
ncbi:GntR family transcriptional regulator [Nocardia sp. NPDC004260]